MASKSKCTSATCWGLKQRLKNREDDERCKTDASTHILDSSLCAGDFLNFSAIKELLVSFLISLLPPHTFPVWLGWPFPSCNGFLNHGDIFFIKLLPLQQSRMWKQLDQSGWSVSWWLRVFELWTHSDSGQTANETLPWVCLHFFFFIDLSEVSWRLSRKIYRLHLGQDWFLSPAALRKDCVHIALSLID